MATIVGGLRARLIHDSAYEMIRAALSDLGWFDSGRRHEPVTMVAKPVSNDDQVPFNTLTVSSTDVSDDPIEMGSTLSEDRWTFYVDFYGEDDLVARHIVHDIRDVVRGKLPSIGRAGPVLDVYDYRLATPVVLFRCELENVVVDRANTFTRPWQRHWWAVRFDVVDEYADEYDDYDFIIDGGTAEATGPDVLDGGSP